MRLMRILGLILFAAIAGVSQATAQIISITVAPPVLPVYVQPPIPGPGYIWTPGYWAWGDDGYYWVPGTWVLPPTVGLLWTPGYWGWSDGIYVWNAGYWGPTIGFYGGINYGFGYTGVGYAGGYWAGGVFTYNRTVNNFGSVNITNVYSKTVINNTNVTNVSFNGGTGGTKLRPTQEQLAIAKDPKNVAATTVQTQHQNSASTNKALFAKNNNGNPTVAATSHAGTFTGPSVTPAKTAATGATGGTGATGTRANTANTGGTGATGTRTNAASTGGTGATGTRTNTANTGGAGGTGTRTNAATGTGATGTRLNAATGTGATGTQPKLTNTRPFNPAGPTGPGPGAGPGKLGGAGPAVQQRAATFQRPNPANFAQPRGPAAVRPGGGGGGGGGGGQQKGPHH